MKFLFLLLLIPALALGQAFTFSDLPFLAQGSTDWQTRVVANGGAMPSANTIAAMETLRLGCIAAGLTNKIYSLCVFVPDSLIAATTPLFLHKGVDPWTNNNFLVGDLTINGLKGDGSTKSLDTGVKAKDVQLAAAPPRGITVIVSESSSNAACHVVGQQDADDDRSFNLLVSSGGSTEWYPTSTSITPSILTNDYGRVGYVSGNLTTNTTTNVTVYVASALEAHKVLHNKQQVGNFSWNGTVTEDTISVFANKHGGTNRSWAPVRMSLAMIHNGFTETESSNFWILAKACRETLGGGVGDPVQDWARKIVAFGGAAISTTTSNAMRTFYSGLETDAILYRMVAVNAYVPDNLTAARTPIIWQAGSESWTNANFGETNLTVNGLTGNTTSKSLGTGILPASAAVREFSSTSAGISIQMYNIPTSANLYDFGTDGSVASSQFALVNNAGTLFFYCWKFINVNQDYVRIAAPSPGGTFASYLSGNRTAATAIRLDWVTNGVHNIATNGTGTQTGSTTGFPAAVAHALNADGTVTAWSDHTISFLAIHSGLTQTQSSNLWNRVVILRTALGGGIP